MKKILIDGTEYVTADDFYHFAQDYRILKESLERIKHTNPFRITPSLPNDDSIEWNFQLASHNALMTGGNNIVE